LLEDFAGIAEEQMMVTGELDHTLSLGKLLKPFGVIDKALASQFGTASPTFANARIVRRVASV
jgi:hypothetical protein